MRKFNMVLMCIIYFLATFGFGFFVSNTIASDKLATTTSQLTLVIDDKDAEINQLKTKVAELEEQNSELKKENNNLKYSVKELTNKAQTRMKYINEQNVALDEFRKRSELFNSYEIAIMNTYNKRTDMTYDELEYLDNLCKEKGIPTMMIVSMIKLESNFDPNLKSNESSAKGYMQVIKGTGKFTYENLMGNEKGSYDHSLADDPKTNLKLGVTYIDYLFDRSNGDVVEVIKRYSGWYSPYGIGQKYFDILSKHMSFSGYSLEKAQQEYNSMNS